jgi:hypothetical protein
MATLLNINAHQFSCLVNVIFGMASHQYLVQTHLDAEAEGVQVD